MYQKIIAPIFAAMPDPEAAETELSAIQRARLDDDALANDTLSGRLKMALKPQE